MAQSNLTVTTPNPTPPTNLSVTGATPPNVPNYTKLSYLNWVGVGLPSPNPGSAGGTGAPGIPPGYTNAPPFFDDGVTNTPRLLSINEGGGTDGVTAPSLVGSKTAFSANTAALASGTGATSGGTENTYPGASAGAVPASTSLAHEGAGSEVTQTQSYNTAVLHPIDTVVVSTGPASSAAAVLAGPNANHASSLSPAGATTLTTINPTTSVHGTAAVTMTCTGTNFTRQSRIYIGGVAQTTTYVSPTSLTCLATPPALAGANPAVTVITGGVVTTAPQTWTTT